MVTASDLQYGFFIDFHLHVHDSLLIMQPLFVCFRVEDMCITEEEARKRSWVERSIYVAFRKESDMYRVEGQLPTLFRNERNLLVISATDCRGDEVFSAIVTPRWIRTQLQRLMEGLEADPLQCGPKNRSDLVETTLWVRCIGSEVGRCIAQPLPISPSLLDVIRPEKECLAFRSWTTSLVQKENFPFTMASQHCSLPIYCLCCLEDVVDRNSFGFVGRLPFSPKRVIPWINDWCKAWTVASIAVRGADTLDRKQLLWWCFVDLLVGNTSSHRKEDMCYKNEMPMPSFSLSRFSSPLDRLARRLALSRYIWQMKDETAEENFMKCTVEKEEIYRLFQSSWACVAVACDDSGKCFMLHSLCGKKKLDTLKTGERLDALQNTVFYWDEYICPPVNAPIVSQLLMLCWCDVSNVFCVIPAKPFPKFVRLGPNEYVLHLGESQDVHSRHFVPLPRVHTYISLAIATDGLKMLRPHLAELPVTSFPAWVPWQIGWIHSPSSPRVARNMPLSYLTPLGFQMPLARTQQE